MLFLSWSTYVWMQCIMGCWILTMECCSASKPMICTLNRFVNGSHIKTPLSMHCVSVECPSRRMTGCTLGHLSLLHEHWQLENLDTAQKCMNMLTSHNNTHCIAETGSLVHTSRTPSPHCPSSYLSGLGSWGPQTQLEVSTWITWSGLPQYETDMVEQVVLLGAQVRKAKVTMKNKVRKRAICRLEVVSWMRRVTVLVSLGSFLLLLGSQRTSTERFQKATALKVISLNLNVKVRS